MKEFVEPSEAEKFSEFAATLVETTLSLPSGYEADIIKADVKTKKDKALLIMRYQLSKLI